MLGVLFPIESIVLRNINNLFKIKIEQHLDFCCRVFVQNEYKHKKYNKLI